jgi:AcrR family transcriptional regulator
MTVEEALAVADRSSRERILAATAEVLGRNGMTKLSLSEVALRAGVSRPTLYRWFASKMGAARRLRGVGAAVLRARRCRGDRRPSGMRKARRGVARDRRVPAVLPRIANDRHRTGPRHQATVAGDTADATSTRTARARARSRPCGGDGRPRVKDVFASSARISSVCSPSSGAAERGSHGVP